MSLLPINQLGALELTPGVLTFGLYLPGVTAETNITLAVKIIHEGDQFIQDIQPLLFDMALTSHPDFPNGDYWTAVVDTTQSPSAPLSHWGKPGRYIYRYIATPPDGEAIDFIVDPYAREYGVGDLSAVTVGFEEHIWSEHEAGWKAPALRDLIAYELMIAEFGGDLEGVIKLLDYLKDLGINCIELMPVNNVKNTINWGYDPFGYFGVDNRFGNRKDFQRFVDEAHQRGIAVMLDVVYGHTTGDFTFPYLYPKLGLPNPFNGPGIRDNGYGPMPDFRQPFAADYFYTANHIWLDKFHIDGFRYDNVPAFWSPSQPKAEYGALVKDTYQLVWSSLAPDVAGTPNYWNRFDDGTGKVTLLQVAEYLDDPPAVVNNTFSNGAWQDWTLAAAKKCAHGEPGAIGDFGRRLGLQFFPEVATVDGVTLERTAFQYIENHDHSRFICEFGLDKRDDPLQWKGLESNWYKLQPYLIGLLLSKGVPLLWEGEEFLQTYFVPDSGNGRQLVFRPVDFSNFYSDNGKHLLAKVRRLIQIRKEGEHFRRGSHFFYDVDFYENQGLLLFSRSQGMAFSMVALNFTDSDKHTTIQFPRSGTYREELDGVNNLVGVIGEAATPVTIPSNYGQIWTRS